MRNLHQYIFFFLSHIHDRHIMQTYACIHIYICMSMYVEAYTYNRHAHIYVYRMTCMIMCMYNK